MIINPDVKSVVEAELRNGERILWAHKPTGSPLDVPALVGLGLGLTLLIILFPDVISLMLQGLSNPTYGAVFLTLIILIGLLWSLRAIWLPSYEIYALTNHRILIFRLLWPRQLASIDLEHVKKVKVSKSGNYWRIALLISHTGFKAPEAFEGSFHLSIPFFKVGGHILHCITEPEKFVEMLNSIHPTETSA